MVGNLSTEQIDALLLTTGFAHLGCHADGKTYVIPISFALDGDRLVGQTTIGLKIEMMRKNPEVCVEVSHIEDLTHWQSVLLQGRYEELHGTQAAAALGLLIDKYGPIFMDNPQGARRGREVTPPRIDAKPEPLIVYAIQITERTGRFEGS